MNEQGLLILHLSDLHFGNKSRFVDRNLVKLGKAFHRAITHASSQADIGASVRLVIVSGDLTEVGHEDEFNLAREFLDALSGQLGVDPTQFVFSPGNHDVSWPLCKIEELRQQLDKFDNNTLRCRIDQVKFSFYSEFLSKFFGRPMLDFPDWRQLEGGCWVHDFPAMRLSIASLNTCEIESHRPVDHRGSLSEQQASALQEVWLSPIYDRWMKIVALHHNPIASTPTNINETVAFLKGRQDIDADLIDRYVSDIVGFEGRDTLRKIVSDCSVHLVLHGHHHDQGDPVEWPWAEDGRAPVLSTGSWGLQQDKLPGDAPPSCQLLWITRKNGRIRLEAHPLVYNGRFRLAGDLLDGNFVMDPARRGRYSQVLSLNDDWFADPPRAAKPQLDEPTLAFMRRYRQRMRPLFDCWDLQYTGIQRESSAVVAAERQLDSMYQPQRLSEGYDPQKVHLGKVFDIAEIRGRFDATITELHAAAEWQAAAPVRVKPFIIRGPAGAGKTTWMRYTFRRLVRDEQLLPLMIVLRDLAKRWSDNECQGAARSLDAFLDDWVSQHLGDGWEGRLRNLLRTADYSVGPRVVLLVDGWDELGPFGVEFREKLMGFSSEYPCVLIIASSRPYGEGKPSNSDGFDTFDVQPLCPTEIDDCARRFFGLAYESDETACNQQVHRFREALNRSPEAAELAQTMLMLLMMLSISRSEPLPEKRHLLYERCLGNLLSAREQRGVVLTDAHWRPADIEVRRQATAHLAYEMQLKGYRGTDRSAVAMDWSMLVELLPKEWNTRQRDGFLTWLSGPAGILVARADGTLAFAHLSFQEFLAAWHMNATITRPEAVSEMFLQLVHDARWSETLLLWAAQLNGQNRDRLTPVLEGLMREPRGSLLVGLMLAEGLGTDATSDAWTQRFVEGLLTTWPDLDPEECLRAWRSSREELRKGQFVKSLNDAARRSGWQGWLRMRDVGVAIDATKELPLPDNAAAANVVSTWTSPDRGIRPAEIAGGRILCGGAPLWPGQPSDVALLHLWPTRRREAGLRLQHALACGATLSDIKSAVSRELVDWSGRSPSGTPSSDFVRGIDPKLAGDLARELSVYWARSWSQCASSGWASDWASYWVRYWERDWTQDMMPESVRSLVTRWSDDLARDSASGWARGWDRHWARDWAKAWACDWSIPEGAGWLEDFSRCEFLSWGRGTVRSFVARIRQDTPAKRLLSVACQVSLAETPSSTLLETYEDTLRESVGAVDPLWMALAKHITRRSTEEDRVTLTDLACDPTKLDEPVCWGLRYIVRGDLLLPDGVEVSLDQLCDAGGLPHLPYLDEVPNAR